MAMFGDTEYTVRKGETQCYIYSYCRIVVSRQAGLSDLTADSLQSSSGGLLGEEHRVLGPGWLPEGEGL